MSSFVYKVEFIESLLKCNNIAIHDFSEIKGEIVGSTAVYGNIDRQGDLIVRGALDEFASEFKKNNIQIPFLNEHNKNEVLSTKILDIESTKSDVIVTASFDNKEQYPELYKSFVKNCKEGNAYLSGNFVKNVIAQDNSVIDKYGRRVKNANGNRFMIKKSALGEVSYTTDPANMLATIDIIKSMNGSFDIEEILKNITNVSSASSTLYKMASGNISHEQCDKLIKHIFDVAKKKNTSPVKDFISEPAKAQNNDPLYDLFGI
jgi:hypothetical protein